MADAAGESDMLCIPPHTSICETMGCSAALETAFCMTLPVHVLSLARDCSFKFVQPVSYLVTRKGS
eukprot:4669739-Prymnesium_polylepis.1